MAYQILGILTGLFSGVILEILATSPYKHFPALFPSQINQSSSGKIHMHHWIWYFLTLLIVLIWSFKTEKLFHPAVLFISFFLAWAILLNFFKFPDWYVFIK